jgi:hypothetical protein
MNESQKRFLTFGIAWLLVAGMLGHYMHLGYLLLERWGWL